MNSAVLLVASIPSPESGVVEIGPLNLHVYGFLLAVGILVATVIANHRYVNRGGKPGEVIDVALWIVLGGIIGARVYHLFTGYDWDANGLVGTVAIWEGGLSIWGAVGGGAIALIIVARVRKMDSLALVDSAAVGVIVAQAIGRWGNYFNQELFGGPSDLPWALEIDPHRRPPEYVTVETFHPTFLYESLYCLLVLGILLWAERAFRFRKGQTAALYIALYTFGRFWFENLRTDPASEVGPLRINAWVSLVLFVFAIAWFVWLGRRPQGVYEVAPWADPPHVQPPDVDVAPSEAVSTEGSDASVDESEA